MRLGEKTSAPTLSQAAEAPGAVWDASRIPSTEAHLRELCEEFQSRYGTPPRIFRAPGRINLIGEHTDYNDGYVLPAAINLHTWVAIAPRQDRKLALYSENFDQSTEVSLDDPALVANRTWRDYVVGVVVMLKQAGYDLPGANVLIRGELPIGSGLSSSASIEVASALALLSTSNSSVPSRVELAQLCQRAENEFVGMRCGIMDQFMACHGVAGHAILLDCRSLDFSVLPLDPDISLVACNTMVKHELATGEYNARRAECEEGVRLLARFLPHVKKLRDVSLTQLEQYASGLPELIYRRCRHIVSENERVLQAADRLKADDLAGFGKLMAESHRSLRDDFEVSCFELDVMVELAAHADGVLGARMTGGGFGGCTVNLVRSNCVGQFSSLITRGYRDKTGLDPEIYVLRPAQGVEELR
jgi:galactokinase